MKRLIKDRGILCVTIAALIALTATVFAPSYASASADLNERYERYVSSYNSALITRAREKKNISPMSTYNDKSDSSYYAKGVGRYSGGATADNYSCDEGTAVDYTLCNRGYAYNIRTNVYEHGYNHGSLKLYPQFGTGTVRMLWRANTW